MRCREYSDEEALDERKLAEFLATVKPDDLAVMISAKSSTSLDLRRKAMANLTII